jgi:hypothetical protein
MDRAIPQTRHRALARWRRRAAPFVAVVAVAALIPAALYIAQWRDRALALA